MFQLKDMQDWDVLKFGNKLKTVYATFCLKDAIIEAMDIMRVKSDLKGLFLKFDQDYFG
jgi:hypothetical protein